MASSSPAPQVPDSADFHRERQDVVEEFWNAGNEHAAELIATDDRTRVEEEESDLVPDGWKLLNVLRQEHNRINHYVVSDSRETTISLTGDPDSYNAFAEAAEVQIDSEESAIAAVEFYLLKTRDARVYRKTVEDADQLTLEHAPFPDIEEEVREARENAEDVIAAPAAEESGDGYAVTVYFQQDDSVRSWEGTVSRNGTLEGGVSTHTTDLPVSFES